MLHYDVIIIGGGLVGLTVAHALTKVMPEREILLVEAKDTITPQDLRLLALSHTSMDLYQKLDLWDESLEPAAIKSIHVSVQGRFGSLLMDHASLQLPALGYVVRAHLLQQRLAQTLPVTVMQSTRVTAIHANTLTLTNADQEQTISATLIIAADGTHSAIREWLGIHCDVHDYQQSALVVPIVTTQSQEPGIAYERVAQQAVVALLPLGGQEMACIWTGKTTFIADLAQQETSAFLRMLQRAFGKRLAKIQDCGQRVTFPLQRMLAKTAVMPPFILLGNAAHTLHPIAAQGLNLALQEIILLMQTLKQHALDDPRLFDTYSKQQQERVRISNTLSHGLASLLPQHCLTARGLSLLDAIAPLKRRLLHTVIGKGGGVVSMLSS